MISQSLVRLMKQHNGLEIDLDLAYHRRFWKVQRIGWAVWALIILAAFVGLFGPGIKGRQTLSSEKSGISITYERFIRNHAPNELQLTLHDTIAGHPQTRLGFSRTSIEAIELLGINPEPEKQQISGEEIFYTFNQTNITAPVKIVFRYETKTPGKLPLQIRLNENPPLFAEQFSFP